MAYPISNFIGLAIKTKEAPYQSMVFDWSKNDAWYFNGKVVWYMTVVAGAGYGVSLQGTITAGMLNIDKAYYFKNNTTNPLAGLADLAEMLDDIGAVMREALEKYIYVAPTPTPAPTSTPTPTPAPTSTPVPGSVMTKVAFLQGIKGRVNLSKIPGSATNDYGWFHAGYASNFILYGKNGDPLAISICFSWCNCGNPPPAVDCIGFGETLYAKDPDKTIDESFANTALGALPYSSELNVVSVPPGAEVWLDGVSTGKKTPATIEVGV